MNNRKTPEILIPALRQYQHNDCSGLLAGFDYDETVKIIAILNKRQDQARENLIKENIELERTVMKYKKGEI